MQMLMFTTEDEQLSLFLSKKNRLLSVLKHSWMSLFCRRHRCKKLVERDAAG